MKLKVLSQLKKLLIFLNGILILRNKISQCNVLGARNAPLRDGKNVIVGAISLS